MHLASRGAVFAGVVVLIGIGAALFGSPETAGAVEPFVKIGVWGGLVPLAAYMGAATVKNIMGCGGNEVLAQPGTHELSGNP